MHICGAKFQEHCFNISRDIVYSVFYHYSDSSNFFLLSVWLGEKSQFLLQCCGREKKNVRPGIMMWSSNDLLELVSLIMLDGVLIK